MKKKRIVSLIIFGALCGAVFAYLVLQKEALPSVANVRIANTVITVRIADTPALRTQGLSGVPFLESDQGMLFVFPEEGVYPFWMKDMLIAIDMVWIDSDRTVVHIEHNVTPETFPKNFGSDVVARYVLELQAGTAQTLGLVIGDTISFSL